MTRVSYLRVYMPMDALRPEERRRWETRAVPRRLGSPRVLTLSDYGLLSEPMGEDALVTEWSGRRFVCPRNVRLRVLEGVLAFGNAYPESLLVPESVVRRAAAEHDRIQRFQPRVRSHILTAPWHVPLRWFAAFTPEERELYEVAGEAVIRYRTLRRRASERLGYAVEVLEEAGFEEDILDEVVELADWLAAFPTSSMVELDYGGVATFFSAAELAVDESAAEVWGSLEALDRGDLDEATHLYGLAASRWVDAQAVAYSN